MESLPLRAIWNYNEKITVTYHNVVVSDASESGCPQNSYKRRPIRGYIVASDSGASEDRSTQERAVQHMWLQLAGKHKIKITISATNLSTVRVTPDVGQARVHTGA